jgi:hypothetical protein
MTKLLSGLVTLAIAAVLVVAPSAAFARPIDAPGLGATPSASTVQSPSSNVGPNPGEVGTGPQSTPFAPVAIQRTASGANPVAQSQPVGNSPSVALASSGFQWSDAGIGAAAMLGFLSIGAAAVLVVRRSRDRGQPAPIG